MEKIKGLKDLIASKEYRQALGLPSEVTETYTLLAQGEYNINYAFVHPSTGKDLLLRVNCGSQMHLDDQIEYEFNALKALEPSGRTPKAGYCDGSLRYTDHGILVMERLPGHALDYGTELMLAADILADIHSTAMPAGLIPKEGEERTGRSLIAPSDPLKAILEECEQMVTKYMASYLGDDKTKTKLRRLLDLGWDRLYHLGDQTSPYRCCINTELNNTNFLINGPGRGNYLIDWEKPLYGDPAQDLGHFLAPTTTFWKTDIILSEAQMNEFIKAYIDAAAGRFDTGGLSDRVRAFTTITCLRGITWCAMAWVEYKEPGRELTNESTRRKLDRYIEKSFLDYIEQILRR